MATGDALLPEDAKFYIVDHGVTPSALTSSDQKESGITNFSQSGGEEDIESVKVFGGGNIDHVQPRSQIEVSFDIVIRYGGDTQWDEYMWGSTLSSDGDSPYKDIYIEFTDGSNYYTRAYQNVKGISFEPDTSADGLVEGSMSFKVSPTNASGNPNFKVATSTATSITWS